MLHAKRYASALLCVAQNVAYDAGPHRCHAFAAAHSYYFNLLSGWLVVVGTAVYFAQMAFYVPHKNGGWNPAMLYSGLTDCVLHYYDGVCVREGPAPDRAGRFLFACYPHGVYGVCRAFSGGSENWNKLYPGITSTSWQMVVLLC